MAGAWVRIGRRSALTALALVTFLAAVGPMVEAGTFWQSSHPWDLHMRNSHPMAVMLSENGERIVVSTDEGIVAFLANRSIAIGAADGGARAVSGSAQVEALSADGRRAVRLGSSGFTVWNVDAAPVRLVEVPYPPGGVWVEIFMEAGGARVYLADASGIHAYDAATGDPLWTFVQAGGVLAADHASGADFVAVAFNPPNPIVPSDFGSAFVVLDGADGVPRWTGAVPGKIEGMAITPDGNRVVVADHFFGADVFRYPGSAPTSHIPGRFGGAIPAVFLRDGSAVALAEFRGEEWGTGIWALDAQGIATEMAWHHGLPTPPGRSGPAFFLTELQDDGSYGSVVWIVGGDGTIVETLAPPSNGYVRSAMLADDGRFAYLADTTLFVGAPGMSNEPPVVRITAPEGCEQVTNRTARPSTHAGYHDAGGAVDVEVRATAEDPEGGAVTLSTDIFDENDRPPTWWAVADVAEPVPASGKIDIENPDRSWMGKVVAFYGLDEVGALSVASCTIGFVGFFDSIPGSSAAVALIALAGAAVLARRRTRFT